MNELKIFSNKDLGGIRVLEKDGQPWFVGKDVAEILGYEAERNAIKQHVDDEDKLTHQISASGQNRQMTIINESGLYSLILSSKLPKAKAFKRWVTSEVLPSIRQTGGYTKDNDTDFLIKTVVAQTTAAVMTQIPQIIGETVKATMQSINNVPSEKEKSFANTNFINNALEMQFNANRMKIEMFPAELLKQVDGLIERMLEEQALNFSMIARFCTMNGYSISSPSVKRYFDKKMGTAVN